MFYFIDDVDEMRYRYGKLERKCVYLVVWLRLDYVISLQCGGFEVFKVDVKFFFNIFKYSVFFVKYNFIRIIDLLVMSFDLRIKFYNWF